MVHVAVRRQRAAMPNELGEQVGLVPASVVRALDPFADGLPQVTQAVAVFGLRNVTMVRQESSQPGGEQLLGNARQEQDTARQRGLCRGIVTFARVRWQFIELVVEIEQVGSFMRPQGLCRRLVGDEDVARFRIGLEHGQRPAALAARVGPVRLLAAEDVGDSVRRPGRARAGLGLQDQVEPFALGREAERGHGWVLDGSLQVLLGTWLDDDLFGRCPGQYQVQCNPDRDTDLILVTPEAGIAGLVAPS